MHNHTKLAVTRLLSPRRLHGLPTRLLSSWLLLGIFCSLNLLSAVRAQESDSIDEFVHRTDRKRLDAKQLLNIMEWKLDDPQQVVEKMELLPGTPAPLNLKIRRPPDPVWNLELTQRIKKEIKAGTKLQFEIESATDFTTPCQLIIESTKGLKDRIFYRDIVLPKTINDAPCICNLLVSKTMAADHYSVRLGLSKAKGHVQFVAIALVEKGQDSNRAKAQVKIAPDQVAHRIDRFRKGNLNVLVVDRNGKSIPNAQVTIEQTSHKFLFGASLKDFNFKDNSPIQSNYEKRFLQIFNYATIQFVWKDMEPLRGNVNYKPQTRQLEWCALHDIKPLGSPLLYDWFCPKWLPGDPSARAHALRSHVRDTIAHFHTAIKAWDVVREVSDEYTLIPNAFGYWMKQDGPTVVTGKALEWGKLSDVDPDRCLLYVDRPCRKLHEVLDNLERDSNLPDALGLETQMYQSQYELADLWLLCEGYKTYNKPLHFNQVTILSAASRVDPPWGSTANDWPSTAGGEAQQAEYVERFYSILFSHPAVESITWWDLCDREAYMGAPAGLLRKDGTPKPAFERLRKLIREQWWTKASLKTDETGKCTTRAFWGRYAISVSKGGGAATRTTVKFYDQNQPVKIIVN